MGKVAGVSRKGQAGKDLVDEVVLPVVQRVSSILILLSEWQKEAWEGRSG